ncbi:MAG: hypothetical protein GY811_26080 [Myxococcales bacterium]|nr:hypothetical protein [Myxococcales bacterium]
MSSPKEILTENELLEEDLIESRIGVHDSNHFEVKLDYAIGSQGRSRYRVDYYFFVPASLGVSKHTYRDHQFFSDVQAYIRFKTPSRTMTSLAGNRSPLQDIRELVVRLRATPKDTKTLQQMSYQLRMFGCIKRANIRDRSRSLREKLGDLRSQETTNAVLLGDVGHICETLVDDIATVIAEWRKLRPDFVDGRLPKAANETFGYVDEYLSLVIEMKMASIVRRIDAIEVETGDALVKPRSHARSLLLAERSYRDSAGYSTVVNEDEDDHFVYRQGLLKKFLTSVLWLDLSKEKEGRRVANVGAAIAAGFAMFFALMVTLYAGERYGINSANFIAAGVGTYILKDRIKDWLKAFLGGRFSRFIADYSIQIRDPLTNARIGKCRESFSFIDAADLPENVLGCRLKDAKSSIESMAKPEVIMHYSKQVNLQGKDMIERMHLEDYNVNDIVRFSLSQFLVRADDPTSSIPYYVEEDDLVERRSFRKVYHLNLVMVLRNKGNGRSTLKRVRVIFDKNAIRELQEVES